MPHHHQIENNMPAPPSSPMPTPKMISRCIIAMGLTYSVAANPVISASMST